MERNYTVYHLHTESSLLDSCTNYKLYIDKAKSLGQTAICFTEHGNIYNWIEKKIYCEKIKKCKDCEYAKTNRYEKCSDCDKYTKCIDIKNIKYLHGVEIYLTETLNEKIRDNFHTILIAKNYEGFKELNNLVDLSTQENHMYYKNRLSFDEFFNISDNIIKISACLASPLNKLKEDNPYYNLLLKKYDYYEIQPHVFSEDQITYNKKLYELSKKYKKPLIMGTDTHSLDKYKSECRSILQKAKKIEYTDEDKFDLTYKSYDELVDMCKQQNSLPENVYLQAIDNTNVMADSVETFELDMSFKYPKLYTNDEDVFKKMINKMYKEKLQKGIIKNDPKYKQNILEEFKIFKKLNMISFMLFMAELIIWCKENGIPVGNCRGSVGGSTIAYITDIIDLDPIKWRTVFSRFCNEDRLEIGDIDVDISPTQRELVYNHIIDKFGSDYTAYILAIGTISDKGTIDEIGRALDFKKDGQIKKLQILLKDASITDVKKIEIQSEIQSLEKSKYGLEKLAKIKKEFEIDPEKTKNEYTEIFYYFDGLLNTAISQSMHPAGIIASPITLPDNYGTIWKEGKRILSINMEEVHEVSLVKYDILGLKNIEIIKDTCILLNKSYPRSYEINWDDENVWNDMITSPIGIFQFESPFAFQLLKKYVPKQLNDLSLANACLRPSGESYRDRLINREFNCNPSKQIDELLKDNNGFLVFQEDVIKFLQDICGLTGSEADNIRRAIGRKQKDRLDAALPKILEGYCNKSDKPRNIAEEEAKAFIKIIEDASSYMFGYNHSTGYSMIGYLCGYYRYYYPLEFITSYLNNANNEDDIKSGTELAKLKNIKIEPIKFRYSNALYSFNKDNNTIYKGISSIKHLNSKISEELYSLRNNKYDSFLDLLKDINSKTSTDSRQLNILIRLNYFEEFGKEKELTKIVEYFDLMNNKKQFKKEKVEELNLPKDLFSKYSRETEKTYMDLDSEKILIELCKSIPKERFSIKDQIDFEQQYLGYIQYICKDKTNIGYVIEANTKYSPKFKIYSLDTGVTDEYKISKKDYNDDPINQGDVIKIGNITRKLKFKKVGDDENGKPIFEKVTDEYDNWLSRYYKIEEVENA